MEKFKKYDRVVRIGKFDGNIGTIQNPKYIEKGLVLVRFGGGDAAVSERDLTLYNPEIHK